MTEMMRAVLCRSPGQLDIVERPVPRRKSGEALVRIRRVGVCGTDLHIFQGDQPYFAYPRIMGHELSGEIVEAEGRTRRLHAPQYSATSRHVKMSSSGVVVGSEAAARPQRGISASAQEFPLERRPLSALRRADYALGP